MPAGFHWCLAPDILSPAELGRDGHPEPGRVLPELPLPRRMWAGGAVTHHGALQVGNEVLRASTVSDIRFRDGRSGRLGFVTVDHVYSVAGETRVTDRQDIVYREDPAAAAAREPPPSDDWDAVATWRVSPDPTLLFRYSAVTFNGHCIHYD